jgi:hypothetical protein
LFLRFQMQKKNFFFDIFPQLFFGQKIFKGKRPRPACLGGRTGNQENRRRHFSSAFFWPKNFEREAPAPGVPGQANGESRKTREARGHSPSPKPRGAAHNPGAEAPKAKPQKPNPKPQTPKPKPQAPSRKPQSPSLETQTPTPKPQNPNRKAQASSTKPQTASPNPNANSKSQSQNATHARYTPKRDPCTRLDFRDGYLKPKYATPQKRHATNRLCSI